MPGLAWFDQEASARDAADTELAFLCDIAVVWSANGRFCWTTFGDRTPGWAKSVRGFDGRWSPFEQPDRALEYARVEAAIVQVRQRLLQVALSPDGPRGDQQLEGAAYLSQMLDTLRGEREALLA